MTEESKATDQTPQGSVPPKGDLFAELNQMGQKLGAAMQAAWESPKRKELSDEVQEGLLEFGKQVDAAIKSARESKLGEEVRETAEKVVEEVRQSKVLDEIRDGMLAGLKQINAQLDKLMTRVTTKPAETPAAAAEETAKAEAAEVVETPAAWPHEGLDAEAAGEPTTDA
ncbi:hypothetical protein [Candidatus Amarolinea aalborgensis]|uniref:hypothetical protein n=1 Tax=Candidatus Amarolinea aalborgensis TaxID=2249329 RepID=UPI003BF9F941